MHPPRPVPHARLRHADYVRVLERRAEHKIHLTESEMPTTWYNVIPDLPAPPPPPLHPGTREPVGPDDLAPLFPMALIEQEVVDGPLHRHPGEVLDVYRLWRPTRCSAPPGSSKRSVPRPASTTSTRASPAGSHKPNTSVPQAYYNSQEGIRSSPPRPAPASGAARWPTPPPSTASTARSGWWRRPICRSRIAAR